jgi:hypothetical protein
VPNTLLHDVFSKVQVYVLRRVPTPTGLVWAGRPAPFGFSHHHCFTGLLKATVEV